MELHAAIIEWALVSAALIGVVLNTMMFRSALSVQRVLQADKSATKAEVILADATVHQEALRVGKQMLILLGGALVLFLAPPPPDLSEVPQGFVLLGTLIAVSLLMTVTSLAERRAQRRVSILHSLGLPDTQ